MAIQLKRAYEPPGETDGQRFLVDRLWPRGLRKEAARLHGWLKGLAPTDELRRWFSHDPSRWPEFQERYRAELQGSGPTRLIGELAQKAAQGTITLVYASRDPLKNNAVVLKTLIEEFIAEHR